MGIKATGILRHIFHGTNETAVIGLQFSSRMEAEEALKTLSENTIGKFKLGQQNTSIVSSIFTSETLEKAKIFFKQKCNLTIIPCIWADCKDNCKNAEIDNVNHSIDFGATFNLEIPFPSIPNEQASLFDK